MRIYVDCEDGQVRHDRPFANMLLARHFAEFGHCCTTKHEYERHPDDCTCDWCKAERER